MKSKAPENTAPENLPGVVKKSFAMFFGGGEIWFEHLDGIYGYTELAMSKFRGDMTSFLRPSAPAFMAVNLDETVIADELITLITEVLTSGKKRFLRVVFVGVDKKDKRRIQKVFESRETCFALGFINDFEAAKEWLISG